MLARCTRCDQTFQTDRYGQQDCPSCGTPVMVAPPEGTPVSATPAGPPPRPSAEEAQDQAAPMDEPASHGGFASAFFATWKKSVFDPNAFFARLRVGEDWGGALPFAIVCLVVGGVFTGLYQGLILPFQLRAYAETLQERLAFLARLGPFLALVLAVALPALLVAGLFIRAGVFHLALMIVGGNKRGFNATFRAVGYAQGPYLFSLVPICGSTIAGVWIVVLEILGASKLHRISAGRAVGAYAVMVLFECCLCCLPITGLLTWAGVLAAHAASQSLPALQGIP